MPLLRAKEPDQLYREVSEYDLVLLSDAPLASAINNRIDRPFFGTFAITPRRLAAGRREQAEDRNAFLSIVENTDHDWQDIAYAVGNVLQCWEHQGTHDAIKEYDAFVDQPTRDVVDAMAGLRTPFRQLTEYSVDPSQTVAVVGYELFTQLDRSILPSEFDRVDLFTEQPFDRPPFHVFESPTEIVDALLDTISTENADRVAVVLDSGSEYSSLVESALEAADIPFYGGPGFIDDPQHRTLLQLLRAGFRGSATTVRDVRPILTQLGIDIDVEHDEKRLQALEGEEIDWLHDFIDRIETRTFADAIAAYERQTGADLTRFEEELHQLGLATEQITSERIDDLVYYLDTYEVPIDQEHEGVLLADAKSAGYVDRPAVFFLGLDESWTHSAPQRPWVDTEAQFDRYRRQFQLLLQSGTEQYYLVEDTQGGQPVRPCLYFGDLLDEEFERFSDLDSVEHARTPTRDETGFDKQSVDTTVDSVELISQSSLNSYVNSPRDYLFGELVDTPNRDYFLEGNLFHDFAEFYVNHPTFVDEETIEEVVEVMLEEASSFYTATDEPLQRRSYRIGLDTIVEYLDDHAPSSEDFLTPTSGWGENFFAEYFDRDLDSPLTERWFESAALGLKGKIDLVQAPDQLLDYKSGHKKSASKVVTRSAIDPPADTPNFQAALYLSYYRTVQPDEPLEFTFFHFLEPMDDVITGESDLSDALTTVSYYPYTFDEYVGSREAYEVLLDGYNDCQETFDDLGYAKYSDIMDQLAFPETTEKAELRASEFAEEFTTAVDTVTAAAIDTDKGCDQAIRELNKVRRRAFFREDLDAFEGFVQERLKELNSRRRGDERFPIDGPAGEPNYRRVNHRDLLLGGEQDE